MRIVIQKQKNIALGSHPEIPKNAKIIDFSKWAMLPGLIDCNTHQVGDANDAEPLSELRLISLLLIAILFYNNEVFSCKIDI